MIFIKRVVYLCLFLVSSLSYSQALLSFNSPDDQSRYEALLHDMRCPKCQNQSLADSESGIAADLRSKVYDMIEAGETNQDIIDYMVARYGEYILYRPVFSRSTMILWLTPVLFLIVGFFVFVILIFHYRRTKDGGTA